MNDFDMILEFIWLGKRLVTIATMVIFNFILDFFDVIFSIIFVNIDDVMFKSEVSRKPFLAVRALVISDIFVDLFDMCFEMI